MDIGSAVGALGALAQETRLQAYRLLVEAGPNGRSAGDLARALDVQASTLSFHLAQLFHAGLVTQRRASRQIFYAADFARMNDLMAFLSQNCCGSGVAVPVCDPSAACAPASEPGPRAETIDRRSRRRT